MFTNNHLLCSPITAIGFRKEGLELSICCLPCYEIQYGL